MSEDQPEESLPPSPSGSGAKSVDLTTPKGIAGWLMLFVIGQVITAIVAAVRLPSSLTTFSSPTWSIGDQVPLYHFLLVLEALADFVLLFGAVTGLVLIWRRHPSTPRFVQVYLLFILLYGVVELSLLPRVYDGMSALVRQNGGSTTELDDERLEAIGNTGRMAAYAAVWILYWLRSRRVANTFAQPRALTRGA